MNWVDLLVVLLALLGAASGARNGMVSALFSFIGVFAGAVVGLKLAPLLLERLESPVAKIGFGVALIVLLVALGEALGMWAGNQLRDRITSDKLTGVDNALGAMLQGVAVLVVAWLVALPFTSAAAMPGLASAVSKSKVLAAVDSVMPEAVQELPDELREVLGAAGFPDALAPFARTPVAKVGPPNRELANSDVVREVRPSVVKIRGRAPDCGRALEGTGFVVAPHRVLTNAHVVAGTDEVFIEIGRGRLDAEVVLYDPNEDIAILSVPALDAEIMDFIDQPARRGQSVIALGYPLGGPYTASVGRIRERINLKGPNIYHESTVVRDVYTVRIQIQSGNSGGPLINPKGKVVGVVFGASVEDANTGFALTAAQVADEVAAAPTLTEPVPTGPCTS